MTIISSGGLPVNEISAILNSDIKISFFVINVNFLFSIFFIYNHVFFKERNKDFYEDFHLVFYLVILLSIFLSFLVLIVIY